MTDHSANRKISKNLILNILITTLLIFSGPYASAQVSTKAIDTYIQEARSGWDVPGMSVAIVKDGKIILAKGYGYLEEGKKKRVDEHSVFAIASNTKAFVSTALATLVDQRKLSWDDRVIDHLPYFRMYDEYVTQNTTVRDILSHRTGLGTFSGDVIWYKSALSAEEVVKKVAGVPSAYSFRAGYGYSNLMFITAGEVIKSVTGKTWDAYIQEQFLDLLAMSRTFTSVRPLDQADNVASPHKPTDGANSPIPYVNWDNMGAAGGILSSANDMAKWMILQLNNGINGNDTIFTPSSQIDLWTPHNNFSVSADSKKSIPSKHFSAYGLGWGLSDYKGNLMVTHSGGYDGMYSKVTLIPDQNIGIVVLTNTMKGIGTPISLWSIDHLLGDNDKDWSAETLAAISAQQPNYKVQRVNRRLEARQQNTKPALALEKYTGTYEDEKYGIIEVQQNNGQLLLDFKTAPSLNATLSHWHFDTFKIEWNEVHAWFDFGTVKFELDNNNQVYKMSFDVPNDDIFFYELNMEKID